MNKNTEKVNNKSRSIGSTRFLLFLYDILIWACSLVVILVSLNRGTPLTLETWLLHIGISLLSLIVWRTVLNVYKQVWRYGGIQCYLRLVLADFFAFLTYYGLVRIADQLFVNFVDGFKPVYVSILSILSVCALDLLGCLTIRMVYRYAYKCGSQSGAVGALLRFALRFFGGGRVAMSKDVEETQKIRVAIIGAGNVGVSLAEDLLSNNISSYVPVCFVDKSSEKVGKTIHDIPVIVEAKSSVEELRDLKVQEIIVAIPNLKFDEKRILFDLYKSAGFKVKVYDYPTVQEAGSKRALREFDIEELLFRKPIEVTSDKTRAFYKDKVVLITGGGGSIGSELSRQIAHMEPKQLVLLDVYENGVYEVQQHMKRRYGDNLNLAVEIISVTDVAALDRVFDKYRPNIVLHAAAHKHVPLMEHNCVEAVWNNVIGTYNTVLASEKYGVERFMMVSTDKAVNPTNVMGATKRMCELIVQCHSAISKTTTFSATRFGNVLGSAGSVIPLFKRQIANGGPVTLTDKRIIRYFMTIPEASQLVLESASMAKNGELYVLDMGKPVKILDLAENMITLSGYVPYRDIDIQEIGLRPGEKLYEELLVKNESLGRTENDLIFVEKDVPLTEDELESRIAFLREAIAVGDDDNMREVLKKAVPTFRSNEEVNKEAEHAEEMKRVHGENK